MDRRFICYLTVNGEKTLKAEREKILNDKLPKLRREGGSLIERQQWLKRVLYLNRLLNYNSNPQCR